MEELLTAKALTALITLTGMEIVLGIDNVVFLAILVQIVLLDIVFSLDSVITAVGMAQQVSVMVAAMVIAMIVMFFSLIVEALNMRRRKTQPSAHNPL